MTDQVEVSAESGKGIKGSSLSHDSGEEAEKKARRTKKSEAGLVKTRCIIATEADHPFSKFQTEVKERGVKGFDPGEFLKEVLDSLPDDFWKKHLDELTPLEYKINAALSDPDMREKLQILLASQEGRH